MTDQTDRLNRARQSVIHVLRRMVDAECVGYRKGLTRAAEIARQSMDTGAAHVIARAIEAERDK